MMNEEETLDQSFRDTIGTIKKDGKRNWVFPKRPSGWYYNARTWVSVFLLAFLFGMPFIELNGQPFLLFNVFERKFIIFGLFFGPYDFHIFLLSFIALVIFVILFTAIYGRVFCGWVCPQTIFMELVFRKIEYLIDGDFRDQKKLKSSPWNGKKIFKRGLKYSIFLVISYLIAHTFMAYLVGLDEVREIVSSSPSERPGGFIAMNVFTMLFFFVFSWFREQACLIVCPYGRLQGVLLDQNSLAVTYDFIRGEPRGKLKKDIVQDKGDCVDCHLCVDVCPTGIDIRNGIQMECVNCTACIDACDDVMVKIKKPKGLIRLDSLSGIQTGKRFSFSFRVGVYTTILVILVSIISILLANRTDVEVNILRTPGMLYQVQPNNKISNLYNFHVINKTFHDMNIELKVKGIKGEIKILGKKPEVKELEVYEGRFMLIVDEKDLVQVNSKVDIIVLEDGKELQTIKTSFLGKVAEE
ncbi:MAG: cytochrome c oxidase accessory protein CcoG [Ignavibacteriales bacterium]|jgi:cytochrome c oxidase accessory protein FixG|nr:cytochrome c oxidase accessory protein CcoG [Ignavibacteriales bacterium]MCC6637497.1 cytochrome c oxidase accessory protein CcoG [Ignavibacteriaceae bacterium]